MATTDQSNQWRGARFAVRGVAGDGAISAPRRYAIFRETAGKAVASTARYLIQQEPAPLAPDLFKAWQIRNGFTGGRECDLALLVIRETLDANGGLERCVIERRRGSVDGPFRGDPARIEFRGATNAPVLFSARDDGTLHETSPSMLARAPGRRRGRWHAQGFQGDDAALRAHFGVDVVVVQRRAPTLTEELIGISAVAHVRMPDHSGPQRIIGCGIGWFGPLPFVLVADFPRLGQVAELPAAIDQAIDAALRERDLVRHETRLDQLGPCVIACDRARRNLFVARPDQRQVRIEPYVASRRPTGTDDQCRWLRYVEAHEGLVTLDTYLTDKNGLLVVLTADDQGQVWHHDVDADGIEVASGPANDTAVALLYRERLAHGPN